MSEPEKLSAYPAGEPWRGLPSVHHSIENIFLKRNRRCTREQLRWRDGDTLEWVCEHGTGHTVFHPYKNSENAWWSHTCCAPRRCCKNLVTFNIQFNDPNKVTEIKSQPLRKNE